MDHRNLFANELLAEERPSKFIRELKAQKFVLIWLKTALNKSPKGIYRR